MAYRIKRYEYVRKRPVWMIRLLMNLTADVYRVADTLTETQGLLGDIVQSMITSDIIRHKKNILIRNKYNTIELIGKAGRPILRFTIEKVFYGGGR